MPYKSDKIKIVGTKYDNRVKLSFEQKEEIKEKGAVYGIRKLGREYGVDHRTIQFILYPERLIAANLNRDWTKYFDRKSLTTAARNLRRRKHQLSLEGKIKLLIKKNKGVK